MTEIAKKIRELVSNNKDDLDITYLIKDALISVSEYVKIVNEMEIFTMTTFFRDDEEDFKEHLSNMDTQRRRKHNAVMVNVKFLNELCEKDNSDLIYDGDITNRYDVANFAGVLVNDIFVNRKR